MANENTAGYLADWVVDDPSLNGGQSIPSAGSLNPSNKTSAAKSSNLRDGVMPFTIYTMRNDGTRGMSLRLLVNPHDVNYGSTQAMNASYGRDAHIVILWGASQSTITGNGVSAGFMTDESGLANSTASNSRRTSLSYANVMAFVSLMRSNGYHALAPGKFPGMSKGKQQVTDGGGNTTPPVETSTGQQNKEEYLESGSYLSPLTGVNSNRVIHVMDNVVINYGKTSYVGSFAAFTLEASAENPYRFSYSFEFVISGLLGDSITGHINDGKNTNTGIRLGVQGTNFYTIGLDPEKLNVVPEYAAKEEKDPVSDPTEVAEVGDISALDSKGGYYLPKPSRRNASTPVPEYDAYVVAAAKQYHLDTNLLRGLIMQESNWKADVTSGTGPAGLGQISEGLASDNKLKFVHKAANGTSPTEDQRFNPKTNVQVAAKYLSGLIKKYGGSEELGLTAYNWGPGNLDKHLAAVGGRKEPTAIVTISTKEQREYAARVLQHRDTYKARGL